MCCDSQIMKRDALPKAHRSIACANILQIYCVLVCLQSEN
jgi:hypothetical protein